MQAVITYSDYLDRPAKLTDVELDWFYSTVKRAQKATGYNVPIIPYDHDLYSKKHRDALGVCCTTDPENPLRNGADTYITIDCYFIDECWREEFADGWKIESDTLVDVIAHELAHLTVWRHGVKHRKLTAELVKKIA